uniref:Tetratricopeptide repeat protein n=1 Tax=Hemiselmis andersenii TaxID=464988 RepID=A0A6T8LIU1_HEMAN|mmetsp:Transcript_35578/g.83327  ORF Transcript_35578/g.83327 Transcript_35578/m.83327 type:complete len:229 (+) Transcript_35578:52-738(+)
MQRPFSEEALKDICVWALDYCLDRYGHVPGFEGVGMEGLDIDDSEGGDEHDRDFPWSSEVARGDGLMTREPRTNGDIAAAIACYQRALAMIPRQEHSDEWGECQLSLGCAYVEQELDGEAREDSFDMAIQHLNAALEVIGPATFPHEYGECHNQLGTVYLERMRGNPPGNVAAAIESFHKCLEVFSDQDHPVERAEVQEKLQDAYQEATGMIEDAEGADDYGDYVDEF